MKNVIQYRCVFTAGLTKRLCSLVVITAFAALTASAATTGILKVSSGAGGVEVSLTEIDWILPDGGGYGDFLVAIGSTLTSAAGTPAVGSTGRFLDLNVANPLPISGFVTFNTVAGLTFDLLTLGPGSPNTNCAAVVVVGQSCSVFVGSPFSLTLTSEGVSVSLGLSGIAKDGTAPDSSWIGTLSTNIIALSTVPSGNNVTPLDIQNFFGCTAASVGPFGCTNQAAIISSTHGGEFVASAVPEPATTALMLIAGLLIGGAKLSGRLRRKEA